MIASSGTRLIAGAAVPDSPIVNDALEYARRVSPLYLFNHAVRSCLFASRLASAKRLDCDLEVVAIGTLLHDIGLTPDVAGPHRFEVNGAETAMAFVSGRGVTGRRAQLIWDLVALNSTPSIALHKEPEVAVGTMGIALDYGGLGMDSLPAADVSAIVAAFPRLAMKQQFARAGCELVTARPETSSDNFLRDFGERFVPGYRPASAVDFLMNAPFDE